MILAKAMGAEVTGTSSNEEKLNKLRELGAADAINYVDLENWSEVVFKKTGGVDRVINAVGGSATDQSLAAVGYGREIASMGMFDLGGKPLNFHDLDDERRIYTWYRCRKSFGTQRSCRVH